MKKENIFHIRLVNGDEIIGKMCAKNSNFVTLEDVLTVDEIKEAGQATIFLSKYSLNSDNKLEFLYEHIVTITKVSPIIANYYLASLNYSTYMEIQKLQEIQRITDSINNSLANIQVAELVNLKNASKESVLAPSSNSVN